MATAPKALPSRQYARLTHPRPSQSRIDVAKALKMRLKGATNQDIGEVFGVSKQAVSQALSKFEPFIQGLAPGQLAAYSEERASLFNVVEQHLTGSLLDPQALEKASLNNRAYALKVIHEARRLEAGQSTSNISLLGKLILEAETRLGGPAPQAIDKPSIPAAKDDERLV